MTSAERRSLVNVVFEVRVPETTSERACVYVCGNAPALGSWSAAGLSLERVEGNLYRGEGLFAGGTAFEWKVTRGRWGTVEKTKAGGEVENRRGFASSESAHYETTVEAWADGGKDDVKADEDAPDKGEGPLPPGPCPRVKLLGSFGFETTEEDRPVWVYTPPGYDENPDRHYPVLYMLDGQNCFDPATAFLGRDWSAGRVQERLQRKDGCRPFIICALAHRMDRSYEYTPVKDYFFEGGGLHTLADLIEQEVAPALKKAYRVLEGPENTGIMGSSLGGLASFHMGWRHPDRFGLAGVISPSLWWAGRYTLKMVSRSRKPASKTRFWIDMGSKESRYPKMLINSVRQLTNLMTGRGYTAKCFIDPGGEHDEPTWRNRLHLPFGWLFPSETAQGR